MRTLRYSLAALLFAMSSAAFAADWKPAPTPLMTKWGKQVTPDNAWKEYPRPQLVRKDWENLNGLWWYAITEKGAAEPKDPDGQILVPFCAESALSGVGKHVTKDQWLWYGRTFKVPAEWKGKRVLLHFGAVDWEATVFVNGKELGTHRGGNDPFSFDITDAMREIPNTLVVRVWDPTDSGAQPRGKQQMKPEGIWYTPVTGIWQTVWLEPVRETHIQTVKITPDVDKSEVEFVVDVVGKFAGGGALVHVSWKGDNTVQGHGKPGKPFRIKLTNPQLWSPDNPPPDRS